MAIINGTAGNDTRVGTNLADTIRLLAGNDSGFGRAGNDTIYGGSGVDRLLGEAGNDSLFGEDGNDVLTGGSGNDLLDGGIGIDTAAYDGNMSTVLVNLQAGTGTASDGSVDRLIGIENVLGGRGNDRITGNGAANRLEGRDGDDTVQGGDGADTLLGDAGSDVLTGGAAGDVLFGGDGDDDDTAGQNGGRGLDGGAGNDLIHGDAGNDTLFGGSDSDQLWGDDGDDTLEGGDGNDVLRGGTGVDLLAGGNGNDDLFGDGGGDFLNGGAGDDILRGSSDPATFRDTFFYDASADTNGGADPDDQGEDVIVDFRDNIDIVRFDAEGLSFFSQLDTAGGRDALGNPVGNDRLDNADPFVIVRFVTVNGVAARSTEIDISGFEGDETSTETLTFYNNVDINERDFFIINDDPLAIA